ncbi:Agc protein kinase, partial [Globisporangium splendens]
MRRMRSPETNESKHKDEGDALAMKRNQSSCGRQRAAVKWEPDEQAIRALAMSDFDVIGVLGVGTYGVVKLARHLASGASVALKVLSKEHIVSMRQEKHILRERMVHLQLQHSFIARLYGTFQDDDCVYLVIEYLPGGELWSLVYSDFDNNDEAESEQSDDNENDESIAPREEEEAQDKERSELPVETIRFAEPIPAAESDKQDSPRTIHGDDQGHSSSDSSLLSLKKLNLQLVLLEEDSKEPRSTQQTQQQQIGHPRNVSRPNSPSSSVMRLDAKSRGLLCNNHGGLKEEHTVFYLACILHALEYLHGQEMLYRDLKLENLVLDRDGYPKVLDFGFAKLNASKSTRNMTLCGSMDYMAPEILLHEPHDQRVDIWSFGIIMYELLLGKTPFFHENTREVGRKITSEPVLFPNEFEEEHALAVDLISKLLVKRPEKRLQSMQEIKQHAFFTRAFPDANAWTRLERRQRPAPFVPKLDGPFDTSFFQTTMDEHTEDELDDFVEPYFEDGSHIFRAF